MRKLVCAFALAALAACSGTDERPVPVPTQSPATTAAAAATAAATTTAAAATTAAATTAAPITVATTRPPSKPTTSRLALIPGRYCATMHAAGWSFKEARDYYDNHGQPAHMDADGDGIPCETVYGEVGGPAPAPQEDCNPAYSDDCLPSPPPDLDCADIGRRVAVDHSYGDPHRLDADGDGYGCDRYG